MEKKITVGLIQQSNTPDREENMLRLKTRIEHCAEQGAQLVVLQELHNNRSGAIDRLLQQDRPSIGYRSRYIAF